LLINPYRNCNEKTTKAYDKNKDKNKRVVDERDTNPESDFFSISYSRREIMSVRENYFPRIIPNSGAWHLMQGFWNKFNTKNMLEQLTPEQKMSNPGAPSLFMPAADNR